jgi:signal peptidase I
MTARLAGASGTAGGIAGIATLAAVAAVVARRRLVIVAISGPSMQPALRTGDRVLVRRSAIGSLWRGQIVVIEKPGTGLCWDTSPPGWPSGDREWLIKRVAALPGDRCPDAIRARLPGVEVFVPGGHLAVLGDNAPWSLDSRAFGYVAADRLLGVMVRPLRLAAPRSG